MVKLFSGFSWIAALTLAISVGTQSPAFAQSKRWNAENLASPFPAAQTEAELIAELRTGEPAVKAIACKQLAIYGSAAAVPELAKLLGDEKLSSWARIALEAIPEPQCDAALVKAASEVKGRQLVGVINSIGVRRSPGSLEVLAKRLNGSDEPAACAAAIALGKIGGDEAVHIAREAFANAKPAVQSAIAEAGILAAERLLAEGKKDQAAAIYDEIRNADVPKQRAREAIRGAIIARGEQGIPLLVEQLKSSDKQNFALGLMVARELSGSKVIDALAKQMATAPSDRAALMAVALGDRGDADLPSAVIKAAGSGDKRVRIAAIGVVGRKGNASSIPTLLEAAADSDGELAQAAKAALAELPGEKVNADLTRRLSNAQGKSRIVLIELAGQRRMNAVPELVKALKHSDAETRKAALTALGAAVGPKELHVLIEQTNAAKNDADAKGAEQALQTACIRMPDREATAAQLAAAMSKASPTTKASLLRILGAMGGPKALETIASNMKSADPELLDVGTRVLGEWMSVDAAPVLLEISQGSSPDKYRVRALRGYLRLARQMKMSDAERCKMFRQALEVAQRGEQRKIVLDALKLCPPSAESVELASSLLDDNELRDRAVETAVFIAEKIKDKDPAAAKTAGEKALKAHPKGDLADRARALTKAP
jgi:HEAT repeat protein